MNYSQVKVTSCLWESRKHLYLSGVGQWVTEGLESCLHVSCLVCSDSGGRLEGAEGWGLR